MWTGPVNGQTTRKQPWVVANRQQWANDLVVAQHTESLFAFGEPALFTIMWRPQDHEAGLVDRCPVCSSSRSAAVFQQPERKKCPACYGTTFEGGIRTQLIRPALFSDRNTETADTQRGTMTFDTLQIETTPDFLFRKGDYIFRGDGTRYQGEEKGEAIIRHGFSLPVPQDSFRGSIPAARLEDPTSLAYLIPPVDPADLMDLLATTAPQVVSGTPEVPGTTISKIFYYEDSSNWLVPHNMGRRYPTVTVTDAEGDNIVLADIEFIDDSTLRVHWPEPYSGRVQVRI